MDVNKTTNIGTVITNPTFITLGNKTPVSVFSMKCTEHWEDRQGKKKSRDNVLKFEVVGNRSHWVRANVKMGSRCYIDGYLRTDSINGEEHLCIRVFHIELVKSDEFDKGKYEGMKMAFGKAINIVESSDELSIAKAKLEVLLSEL